MIGEHVVYIEARLASDPTILAPFVAMPFAFERCPVSLVSEPWKLQNVTLEAGYTANYILEEPMFEYSDFDSPNFVNCSYTWHEYQIERSMVQGDQSMELDSFLTLNQETHTLMYMPQMLPFNTIVKSVITAKLSDGLTVVSASTYTTFLKLEQDSDSENTAPYLVIEPPDKYFIDLDGKQGQLLDLGIIFDRESDRVT